MKELTLPSRDGFTPILLLGIALLILSSPLQAAKKKKAPDPYYKEKAIFFPVPNSAAKSSWTVKNFGPVGIGINLIGTGGSFKMVINNVEPGSPAAATGKLKKKQVIKSISGHVLKDRDPRMILGDLITEAEAKDGKIALDIEGVGDVVVRIPVMGAYSETWPLECQKSDKVVRKLADQLIKMDKPTGGAVLFLLSTGADKDLEVVEKWMSKAKPFGAHQWNIGYNGLGMCEYYLRTGDKRVLPIIKGAADILRDTMYNGGWSGRGKPANFTYSTGSGQMNAAGIHCMSFLMLAQMCGVEVDDYMFRKAHANFFRHGGHGSVPYGDGWPEGGFRDNGKSGGLAITMAIAARLTPKGETSVYAKARDVSAMKSFYATNWFHSAHTGGGIGEIWHNASMCLMHERRPTPYRSFLDTRRWVMELSRRHTGVIGIAGVVDQYDRAAGERGSGMDWGTYFALTYTIPRKTLQFAGAPKTPWCKTYALPDRPWGNENDDYFLSPEPAKHSSISMDDMMEEKVETDASVGAFSALGKPGVEDKVLLYYMHHPEYGLRCSAVNKAVSLGRSHLVLPLLDAEDPRLRDVALTGITAMRASKAPENKIPPSVYTKVGQILEDRDESWWVTIGAAKVLATAPPNVIAKHADRLLELQQSDRWWIRVSTGRALTALSTSPDYYKSTLPPLVKAISKSETCNEINQIYGLSKDLGSAKPEVKAFASKHMQAIYGSVPDQFREPSNGIVISGKSSYVRKAFGYAMARLPGSDDFIKTRPMMTLAARRSGKEKDMYVYNGKFTPNKKVLGNWARVNVKDGEKGLPAWVKNFKKRGSKLGKSVYNFQLLDKGKIKGGGFLKKMGQEFFWSGDMMIGMYSSQEARRMKVVSVDGVDFLLVEKGGFGTIDPESKPKAGDSQWHCGYQIYIRTGGKTGQSEKKKSNKKKAKKK